MNELGSNDPSKILTYLSHRILRRPGDLGVDMAPGREVARVIGNRGTLA